MKAQIEPAIRNLVAGCVVSLCLFSAHEASAAAHASNRVTPPSSLLLSGNFRNASYVGLSTSGSVDFYFHGSGEVFGDAINHAVL